MTATKIEDSFSTPSTKVAFGLYKVKNARVLKDAVEVGYRHFDGAQVYENTHLLSDIADIIQAKRSDFVIATKVWNDSLESVRAVVRDELSKANLDFFDIVYIHWPVPNKYISAYRQLELLVREGIVKNIGISNFSIQEYETLLNADIRIPPKYHQFEVSPVMYRKDLVDYFQARDMTIVASKALSRTVGFTKVATIAESQKVTNAQIMLRWSLERGMIPLCKTSHRNRMVENTQLGRFELSQTDLTYLDKCTSLEDISERTQTEEIRKQSM